MYLSDFLATRHAPALSTASVSSLSPWNPASLATESAVLRLSPYSAVFESSALDYDFDQFFYGVVLSLQELLPVCF